MCKTDAISVLSCPCEQERTLVDLITIVFDEILEIPWPLLEEKQQQFIIIVED